MAAESRFLTAYYGDLYRTSEEGREASKAAWSDGGGYPAGLSEDDPLFAQIEEFGALVVHVAGSLDEALAWLTGRWGVFNEGGERQLVQRPDDLDGVHYDVRLPDPEDDRIVIWELFADGSSVCRWQFSGWHWDPDAGDLAGGPLDQGVLPGDTVSLYALAIWE